MVPSIWSLIHFLRNLEMEAFNKKKGKDHEIESNEADDDYDSDVIDELDWPWVGFPDNF